MLPLLESMLSLLVSIGWLLSEKVLVLASMYSQAWSLNRVVLYLGSKMIKGLAVSLHINMNSLDYMHLYILARYVSN